MLTKLSDYFCSCNNPQRVRNKYTHDYIVTGCRHCPACDKSKSNRYVSMINNMSEHSANTYMVTLTFMPKYLPTASLSLKDGFVSGRICHHRLRSKRYKNDKGEWCSRLIDNLEYTSFEDSDYFDFDSSDFYFYNLGMPVDKTESWLGKGLFGILDYSYPQRFLKRLRKLISYAFPTLVIKNFVAGEYGSKTFRPHFHIIVCTSDSIDKPRFENLCRIAWRYGIADVKRVERNAASYVASYVNSASSLPKFLQSRSIRPFCRHSCFKAFTFSEQDTKERLQELYRNDSPYTLKATPSGFDLFPIPNSLRLFAYPVPPRFRQLSDDKVISILQRYEKACIQQRTLNPRFKVKILVETYLDPYRAELDGYNTDPVIEDAYLTLSEVHDAYKSFSDSSKKCNFALLNKNDYGEIYASYRGFCLARLVGHDSAWLARHVILFYRGSASHPRNFELMLLNYQYSSLELCDSVQDVKYFYSFFNESTSEAALLSAGYDPHSDLSDARKRFDSVVANSHLTEIKHKDRNSYYQYSLYHKS